MLDVLPGLALIERADMAGCGHALAELFHFGPLQYGPEFRLSDQKGLQQRVIAKLEIRQHAHFLNRSCGQVLRLIDDQQAALSLAGLADEEGLQGHQQLGLGQVLDADAKGSADQAQGVFGVELGRDEVTDHHLAAAQAFQQAAQQRRLAGANLTGDDDETIIAQYAIVEIGLGAPVLLAAEIEIWIRVELERLAGQTVEGFVHGLELLHQVGKNCVLSVGRRALGTAMPGAHRDRGSLTDAAAQVGAVAAQGRTLAGKIAAAALLRNTDVQA